MPLTIRLDHQERTAILRQDCRPAGSPAAGSGQLQSGRLDRSGFWKRFLVMLAEIRKFSNSFFAARFNSLFVWFGGGLARHCIQMQSTCAAWHDGEHWAPRRAAIGTCRRGSCGVPDCDPLRKDEKQFEVMIKKGAYAYT